MCILLDIVVLGIQLLKMAPDRDMGVTADRKQNKHLNTSNRSKNVTVAQNNVPDNPVKLQVNRARFY